MSSGHETSVKEKRSFLRGRLYRRTSRSHLSVGSYDLSDVHVADKRECARARVVKIESESTKSGNECRILCAMITKESTGGRGEKRQDTYVQ